MPRRLTGLWVLLWAIQACSSSPFTSSSGSDDAANNTIPDALVPDTGVEVDASSQASTGQDSAQSETSPDAIAGVSDSSVPEDDGGALAALCAKECEATGVGTCAVGVCIIRCDANNDCKSGVECPPGVPCRVLCSTAGSCAGGIDCTGAASCEIHCSAPMSCAGTVQCGGTHCSVDCVEQGSCPRPITCSANDCELSCTGGNSCGAGVTCLSAAKTCNIDCGGATSCGGGVIGSGMADLRCSGFGSCPTSVSCGGQSCAIHCVVNQSCGGAVCCQSGTCTYDGTNRRCQ